MRYSTTMATQSAWQVGCRTILTFHLYLTDNDPWVLAWDGQGTVWIDSLDANVSVSLASFTNRKEFKFISSALPLGTTFGAEVRFNDVVEGNHVRNIRVFRKSHETLLNAGEIFAPHFITRYSGWARIRFMNWQWTNENQQVLWSHRSLTTDHHGQAARCARCFIVALRRSRRTTTHRFTLSRKILHRGHTVSKSLVSSRMLQRLKISLRSERQIQHRSAPLGMG